MSVLRLISAECQGTQRWDGVGGTPSSQLDGGEYYTRLNPRTAAADSSQLIRLAGDWGTSGDTSEVGFRLIKKANPNAKTIICYLGNQIDYHYALSLDTNGDLILSNSAGTEVKTITNPFSSTTTEYRVKIFCTHTDPEGACEIFIDGVSQGSQTGDFFKNAPATAPNRILLRGEVGASATLDWQLRAVVLAEGTVGTPDFPANWEVAGLQPGSGSPTTGGDAPDTGSWQDSIEIPYTAISAVWKGDGAARDFWIQADGTARSRDLRGPSGRSFANNPLALEIAWILSTTVASSQQLIPDAILVQTNLTGSLADIDEGVVSPDGVFLTASGMPTFRCSFPTPLIPVSAGNFRYAVKSNGSTSTNETLVGDTEITETGFSGNLTDIDEDADSPDGNWYTNSSTSAELHLGMENPAGALDESTDAQTVKVYLRKDASGGGTPTFTLEVYDNGSLHETLATDVNVTSDTGQLFTYTWTASGLSSPNNVEIRITAASGGGGPNRRYVEIGTVNWDAVGSELALGYSIQCYESGVAKGTPSTGTVAPSEGTKILNHPFSGAILSNDDGSNVEAYLTQTGTDNGEYIEIDAVDWLNTPQSSNNSVDFDAGNSVDGLTNLATLSIGTFTTIIRNSVAATVVPLNAEYSRVGLSAAAIMYRDINLNETYQDVLYDAAAADRTVTGLTESIQVTESTANVNRTRDVDGLTESIQVTENDADVNQARTVSGLTESIQVTESTANVNRTRDVDGLTESILLTVNVGSVTLGLNIIGLTESIQVTESTANVNRTRDVDGLTESIQVTESDADVNRSRVITGLTESIQVTENDADVNRAHTVSGLTESIQVTESTANVNRTRDVDGLTESIQVTENDADVNRTRDVDGLTESIHVTENDAIVDKGANRTIVGLTESIQVTESVADVNRALALDGITESIHVTETAGNVGRHRNTAGLTEAINISENTADVNRTRSLLGNTEEISLTIPAAVVSRSRDVSGLTEEIHLTELEGFVQRVFRVEGITESIQATVNTGDVNRARTVTGVTEVIAWTAASGDVSRSLEIVGLTEQIHLIENDAIVIFDQLFSDMCILEGRIVSEIFLEGRIVSDMALDGLIVSDIELDGKIFDCEDWP
jgi:hypothetical protein